MKEKINESLKDIIQDRAALLTLVGIIIVSVVFIIYVGIGLQYKDMPTITHYTAFGSQHLYDTSWFEVLSLLGFGVFIATAHSALFIKLRQSKDKRIASVFAFVTFIVLFVAFFIAHQVLRVAAL